MAGDRKQFARAYEKWSALLEEGHLSASTEQGVTAIITSAFTDEPPEEQGGIDELKSFHDEANALAERTKDLGRVPRIILDACGAEIDEVIQDPTVSDVFVIGNGSLSSLILDVGVHYDWRDAANATDHLKQGKFIQRQCGGFSRSLNVPLGLFVVTHPIQVEAALGVEFYPRDLDDEENEKIKPVFQLPRVSFEDIKLLRYPNE